ncbi:Interleukin-36 alpha [Fukomys damarensis]|uniref:Interleukin-1 n=2 Tax=Fukomys damarensis TaxID=885580 RepID=A0A091D6P4_FUKDA|nr:Interleukin-36 alpha [Fukomys damarensis]
MKIPFERHIQDLDQRVWVLLGQTLTMVPRKGNVVPVTVDLYPCKYLETLEKGRGNPMYLGLKELQCSLFCTKIGEETTLQLNKKNVKELYDGPQPEKPFLFYHNEVGSTSTFESAAFPGWFIATGSKGESPVFMTQEVGKTHVTEFVLTTLS